MFTELHSLIFHWKATGGVTSPSGPQTYGVLTTNGGAVTMPFTFTATGTCGSNVQATLSLMDGATSLGNVTFTLPLGLQAAVWSENFDGVTAPALPRWLEHNRRWRTISVDRRRDAKRFRAQRRLLD